MELLVRAGLTPIDAVRAATASTAKAFHLNDRGNIKPGLRAGLLLVAAMGSDIIKFYHGPDYQRQYGIRLPDTVTNLATLAREDPSALQFTCALKSAFPWNWSSTTLFLGAHPIS